MSTNADVNKTAEQECPQCFTPAVGTKLTIISNPSGMLTTKSQIIITRYNGTGAHAFPVYKAKGEKRMGTKEFVKRSWLDDEMVFEGWDLPIQTDSEHFNEQFCILDNKINIGLITDGDELIDPANVTFARHCFLRSFIGALQVNPNFNAKASIMVVGERGDVDCPYAPLYGADSIVSQAAGELADFADFDNPHDRDEHDASCNGMSPCDMVTAVGVDDADETSQFAPEIARMERDTAAAREEAEIDNGVGCAGNFRGLTTVEAAMVLGVLRRRFPWEGTDESVNGADTVDEINQLFADLRARVQLHLPKDEVKPDPDSEADNAEQDAADAVRMSGDHDALHDALQLISEDGDIYSMGEQSVWVQVDSVSVWIRRLGSDVVVELCRTGDENNNTLDTASAPL